MRPNKTDYYLDVAEVISERSTCLKRHYGAVIVKNDEIISTGYNGAVRGMENCCDLGYCQRKDMPRGTGYDSPKCAVHAEANSIISAPRRDMIDADLYLSGFDMETQDRVEDAAPCSQCMRLIANAGIKTVYARSKDFKITIIDLDKWKTIGKDLYKKESNN